MFGMSEPIPDVFPVESRDSMSIADAQLGRGGVGTHLGGDAGLGLLRSHQRLDHERLSPMDEFAEAARWTIQVMKCSKSSSLMESGASLSIVEAEFCNSAELGSGGQSGGFPRELAGVFQVCSEATSGWTITNDAIIEDMKKAYMADQGEEQISFMQWIICKARFSMPVCTLLLLEFCSCLLVIFDD